jgi:hypothetical protein
MKAKRSCAIRTAQQTPISLGKIVRRARQDETGHRHWTRLTSSPLPSCCARPGIRGRLGGPSTGPSSSAPPPRWRGHSSRAASADCAKEVDLRTVAPGNSGVSSSRVDAAQLISGRRQGAEYPPGTRQSSLPSLGDATSRGVRRAELLWAGSAAVNALGNLGRGVRLHRTRLGARTWPQSI